MTAAAVEIETSVASSSNTKAFDGGIGGAIAFVLVVVGAVMLRKTCRTLKKKDVAKTDAFCPSAKTRFLMLALCASLVAANPVRFVLCSSTMLLVRVSMTLFSASRRCHNERSSKRLLARWQRSWR